MSVRRMAPFLLLNIVVSATVVLGLLFWWDGRNQPPDAPAASPSPVVTTPAVLEPPPPAEADAVEVAAPLVEAAAPEAPGPVVHVVQAGETLGRISERYDVSIDDIVSANGLANPNVLSVGQQLQIPVGGLTTPTPAIAATAEATAVPDAPPTPIPTEPAAAGTAVLEITVSGAGQLGQEVVQIVNSGSAALNLSGWRLADARGNFYVFGQNTLFGDGAGINVHTRPGVDSPTDLYWGQDAPRWAAGEMLTLVDADGAVQAQFVIP